MDAEEKTEEIEDFWEAGMEPQRVGRVWISLCAPEMCEGVVGSAPWTREEAGVDIN